MDFIDKFRVNYGLNEIENKIEDKFVSIQASKVDERGRFSLNTNLPIFHE